MKKKQISILSILLLVFIFTTSANALSIDLSLSKPSIAEGDLFSIDVYVQNVFDGIPFDFVIAFGFDIANSDPSIVSYLSADVASPFMDVSSSLPSVDVAGQTFPGITDNDFLLATLNFEAIGVGDVVLGISSLMYMTDPAEGLVYVFGGNSDITTDLNLAVNSAPVPEAATLILMGIGLAGLAGIRRKNNLN